MEELDDISMQLRILLDKYGFRAETLASYLGLSVWQLPGGRGWLSGLSSAGSYGAVPVFE